MPTEQKARKPTRVTCVHGELSGGLSHQQVVPGDGPTGVGGSLHRNFPTRIVDKSIILGRSETGARRQTRDAKSEELTENPERKEKTCSTPDYYGRAPSGWGQGLGKGANPRLGLVPAKIVASRCLEGFDGGFSSRASPRSIPEGEPVMLRPPQQSESSGPATIFANHEDAPAGVGFGVDALRYAASPTLSEALSPERRR